MPTEREPRYSLTELADLAGVTPRTVRYYISQGLLAVDAAPGPGPKYDDGHLARLRLIKRLQREHQPLAEIRRQLDAVDDDTILALAAADEPSTAPTDSALDYIRRSRAVRPKRPPPASPKRHPARCFDRRRCRRPSPGPASTGPHSNRRHPRRRSRRPSSVTPAMRRPRIRRRPRRLRRPRPHPGRPARIERSQWERVELAPDVELHIRRPSSRATAKRVDRLISIARDLFREDPS